MHVRTEVNPPQELIRALIGGRLDIIVVLGPPNIAELNVTEIGHLELVMVASQKDASLDDIPRIGHVFVDWGTAFNLQQARLFSEPVAPILHTGQSHIALEFILSHGGAAFLPKAIVAHYTAAGHLFNVSGMDTVSREVYAAYSGSSEHLQEMMPIVEMLEALELKPTDPMP
ncbi:MAG: DNA-binding transcriptional LysR family regulator [Pseudohongiellaceae bacterium]